MTMVNEKFQKKIKQARWWWRTPLVPALNSQQRQADLCEFKASLVYKR